MCAAELALPEREVHVWTCDLDACNESVFRLAAALSAEERERARSFRFDRDRRRFIVAHALLRDVIGRYLPVSARAIAFSLNSYGKPSLSEDPGIGLNFNLSHSSDMAICALTRHRRIGADIEEVRPIQEMENLAAACFSDAERIRVCEFEPEARREAFFACWTRKEAYIKARGEGLSIPLDSFEVGVDPRTAPGCFSRVLDESQTIPWWWSGIQIAEGFAAAIVVEDSPPGVLRNFLWDPVRAAVE